MIRTTTSQPLRENGPGMRYGRSRKRPVAKAVGHAQKGHRKESQSNHFQPQTRTISTRMPNRSTRRVFVRVSPQTCVETTRFQPLDSPTTRRSPVRWQDNRESGHGSVRSLFGSGGVWVGARKRRPSRVPQLGMGADPARGSFAGLRQGKELMKTKRQTRVTSAEPLCERYKRGAHPMFPSVFPSVGWAPTRLPVSTGLTPLVSKRQGDKTGGCPHEKWGLEIRTTKKDPLQAST